VWYKDHNIDNFNDTEVYYSGRGEALYYSGIDVYRRYVQQVPQSVTGYSKSNVYTNHEYIVKYDGLGFERENIIYVLESAASFTKGDFFSGRTLDTEFDEWDEKGLDTDGCNIMYFISEDEYVCMRELSDPDAANENPESWGRWIFHSDYGEEDAEQLYNITMSDENCWAAPDTGRCRIVPDIIGESGSQAEQILEQYGVTYKMVYPYGYNQYLSSNDAYVVKSLYPDSDVVSMNDVVRVYLEEK
jgi:hypothetical protein